MLVWAGCRQVLRALCGRRAGRARCAQLEADRDGRRALPAGAHLLVELCDACQVDHTRVLHSMLAPQQGLRRLCT